jgi:hypothetical protein
MSSNKNATSSNDQSESKEEFGLTGTTTGSSGEHLATTGASALGSSGASGEMGNERSKIDESTGGIAPSGSTMVPSATSSTD